MAKITALDIADQLTGDEHLPIVQGADTKRVTMGAFRDLITPFLQYWYKGDAGDTGASDNTYVSRALLRASDITRKTASLVGDNFAPDGRFNYETRNGPYVDDDGLTTLVPEGDAAGAWVRQQAAGLVVRGVVAKDAQARFDELEVVMPFAVGDSPEIILAKGQAAIDFAPAGSTVVIPKGDWLCSTSKMSLSWLIAKRLNLRVDGRVRMTEGTRRADPPTLLRITGANVTIEGNGELVGPGTFDSVNVDESDTFPRIIDVAAPGFRLRGLRLVDPPKVGLFLRNAMNPVLSDLTVEGGTSNYSDTALFGVRIEGGAGLTANNPQFLPNASGGKVVTGFFSVDQNGIRINGGVAYPWEKFSYLFGDFHVIINPGVFDALKTDCFRFEGSGNRLLNAYGTNVEGICTVYNGSDNLVLNPNFTRIQQAGVSFQTKHGYAAGMHRNRVEGGSIRGDPASTRTTYGVDFYGSGACSMNDCEVVGTSIDTFGASQGPGFSLIRVMHDGTGDAPGAVNRPRISSVTLSNGINAIIIRRALYGEVRALTVHSVAGQPIVTTGGAGLLVENARGVGGIAYPGIAGFSKAAGDVSRNNTWMPAPLEFLVAIPAGENTVTVALPDGIAPEAEITNDCAIAADDRAIKAVRDEGIRVGRTATTLTIATVSGNRLPDALNFIIRPRQ